MADTGLEIGVGSNIGGGTQYGLANSSSLNAPQRISSGSIEPLTGLSVGQGSPGMSSAFNVASSGGQGALMGTQVGGWVGAIVGGAIGLVKGVLSEALGANAEERDYQRELDKFNRKMALYYSNAQNAAEQFRSLEEERKKDKAKASLDQDRQNKLLAFLRSKDLREQARTNLVNRRAA